MTAAPVDPVPARFVTTRYQGSKQRSFEVLGRALRGLAFDSAVDVFGGTGAVSWLLKSWGKRVHFNDRFRWCGEVATALVENSRTRLGASTARALFEPAPDARYDDFIARTFEGVYYLPGENRWLDVVAQNIAAVADRYERALARYALFQACLKKRPFNLFHRANLAVRTRDVPRTFGNKATWERPFEELFLEALDEANAAVFDNGHAHHVTSLDAGACPLEADLVYLDPPYVRSDGAAFDYLDGYHFLEGLVDYAAWPSRIDSSRKHRPFVKEPSVHARARTAPRALAEIVARAALARFVVISYRADGVPSVTELEEMLRAAGRQVTRHERGVSYALSTRSSHEVVLVGEREGMNKTSR